MIEREAAQPRLAIWQAIAVGLVWINVPVVAIIAGCTLGPLLVMYRMEVAPADGDAVLWRLGSGLAFGFAVAWLWWSVMVPQWRLWAYERVDDVPKLKRAAVAVGLIWPDGWIFERTEIKSKAHAARERALERERQSPGRGA